MTPALVNRLRVSGPLPDEAEKAATRKVLQFGIDLLEREGLCTPVLKAVVWRLAEDAAETLHKIPDRERGWLASGERSIWPEIARASEECRAVEREIANELGVEALRHRVGSLVYLRTQPDPLPRTSITDPTAVDRMLVVLSWLRFVRGRNRAMIRRDQRMFLDMARGVPPRDIKSIYSKQLPRRCSDATIQAVKGKVLLHLTLGLLPYSKQLTINNRSRNLC